jgi:hypothetical protein
MFLSSLLCSIVLVSAKVTVYNTLGVTQPTATSASSNADANAYNSITLDPPPLPTPLPPTSFQIPIDNSPPSGVSIKIPSSFFGFSIEFAVASQLMGKNATRVQPIFLNLMYNIQQRAGSVNMRIGGKSADFASVVPSLDSGQVEAVLYGSAVPVSPSFLIINKTKQTNSF